jgi:transcriptional regulator with XRE-family HTH domain
VDHQDKLLKILFSAEKGKLLKAWREELKLTQTQLASVTGIKQSAISKIESGYSVIPLETFVSLLQALMDREDVMRSQQASAADSGDGGTSKGS